MQVMLMKVIYGGITVMPYESYFRLTQSKILFDCILTYLLLSSRGLVLGLIIL